MPRRWKLRLGIGNASASATSFVLSSENPLKANDEDSSSWNDSHPLLAFRPASDGSFWSFAQDPQKDDLLISLGLTDLQETRRIGRYLVLALLGRGGMSTVLEAHDTQVDRRVALKILHSVRSEAQSKRLLREAQALARISHPNVVQVFEIGEQDGKTFVAMELVRGKTLQQWQDQWPRRPWKECVEAYLQAGRGLAAAHEKGLVHRDFKPSNCIIDDQGRVQVLDFGLAAQQVNDPSCDDAPALPLENMLRTSLTQTGTVIGTLAYMSPEQLGGHFATAQSDQFSFCVSLHEAILGVRPTVKGNRATKADADEEVSTQSISEPIKIPRQLRKILWRGLAARPEDRWLSMNELVMELQRVTSPSMTQEVAGRVVTGFAAGAIILGINHYVESMNLCSGASNEITDTWNSNAKERVRRALLATGTPDAHEIWASVEYRIDRYVDEWTERYTDICAATVMRKEQSEDGMELRQGCLREQEIALKTSISILSQADARVTERATMLANYLPALARCNNIALLQQEQGKVRQPWDPWLAVRVMEIRAKLPPATTAQAASLVQQAKDLGYAQLLAETKLMLGRLNSEEGHYDEAEREMSEAYVLAIEQGHQEVALASAADLTMLVGFRQSRDDGIRWSRTTLAIAERDGSAMARTASIAYTALLFYHQGRLEDAKRLLEKPTTGDAYKAAGLPSLTPSDDLNHLVQNAIAPFTVSDQRLRQAQEIRAEIATRLPHSISEQIILASQPPSHADTYASVFYPEIRFISLIYSTSRDMITLLTFIVIIAMPIAGRATLCDNNESGIPIDIPCNPRIPHPRILSQFHFFYFPDRLRVPSQTVTSMGLYSSNDVFMLSSLPPGLQVMPGQAEQIAHQAQLVSVDARIGPSTVVDPACEFSATGA